MNEKEEVSETGVFPLPYWRNCYEIWVENLSGAGNCVSWLMEKIPFEPGKGGGCDDDKTR